MDVTDDQVHGSQEGAFLNTYYNGVCYAPLYIFCGYHLLAAKLRPSNVDPAEGALEELQRIIRIIREKWQSTQILVRGDSAYAREDIMKFCEEEVGVDYALAMATNYPKLFSLAQMLGFLRQAVNRRYGVVEAIHLPVG